MKQYYAIKIGHEFSGEYHINNIFPTESAAISWLKYRGYVFNERNKYWEVPNDPTVDDGRWWKIQPVVLLEDTFDLYYGLDTILEKVIEMEKK